MKARMMFIPIAIEETQNVGFCLSVKTFLFILLILMVTDPNVDAGECTSENDC